MIVFEMEGLHGERLTVEANEQAKPSCVLYSDGREYDLALFHRALVNLASWRERYFAAFHLALAESRRAAAGLKVLP